MLAFRPVSGYVRVVVRILNLFLATAFLMVGFAGQAEGKKVVKVPNLGKVTAYWATVEVVGGIEIISDYDTTSSCLPGRAWRMTEEAHIYLKGRVLVSIVRGRVGTTLIPSKQPIRQASWIDGYRETNYCEGGKAKLVKPNCKASITGKPHSFITSLEDKKERTQIRIVRKTGAGQHSSCRGPSIDPDTLYAQFTAFQRQWTGVSLPLKLDRAGFLKFRLGQQHRTAVNLRGHCDDASVKVTKSSALTPASTEGCRVAGHFTIDISRPKPKKAKAKKAKAKKGKPKKAR